MSARSRRGKRGEDEASTILVKAGFEIVARNFRCPEGEVDIIALDHGTLVFVEVKNWQYMPFSELENAIDAKKQGRIIKTAKSFIDKYREYSTSAVRFDVVFLSNEGTIHIPDAFMENI